MDLKNTVKNWLKENKSLYQGYVKAYTIQICLNESKKEIVIYTDNKDFYKNLSKSTKYVSFGKKIQKEFQYELKSFSVLSYGLDTEDCFFEIVQSNEKVKTPDQLRAEKEREQKREQNKKIKELAKERGLKVGDQIEFTTQEYNQYDDPEEMMHNIATITEFAFGKYGGSPELMVFYTTSSGYNSSRYISSVNKFDPDNYDLRHMCYMENNGCIKVGAKVKIDNKEGIWMIQRVVHEFGEKDAYYIKTAEGIEEIKDQFRVTHAY